MLSLAVNPSLLPIDIYLCFSMQPVMKRRKLTPLYVVLPVATFLSLFYALYYLFIENRGGRHTAGILLLSLSIGLASIFIVERILVRKVTVSLKTVWLIELLFISAIALFYAYKRSTYYYTVSDNTKWFAILKRETKTTARSHYSFPFNKEISIDSNQVLLVSRKDIGKKREAVRSAGYKWRGYSWQSRQITVNGKKINLNIFCRPRTELTYFDYKKMEELLLEELKQ